MNLFRLSLAYLRRNALSALLNLLLLALGIATITVLLLFSHQMEQRLTRDAGGIDMVVGAQGSPMQLILSSIFHIDAPTGNIPLEDARWVQEHPLVADTIPLALGDSYRGFRIVGSEHSYIGHYGGTLADGALWEDDMEAVLGARVAERTGLGVGDTFVGVHGITAEGAVGGEVHDDHPYTITGVLEPTGSVADRLIHVSVPSVWKVHDHDHEADHEHDHGDDERELTALLVQYQSPLAAVTLPRAINSRGQLQAAAPAYQTARLMQLMGVGMDTLRAFGWILVAAAGLGVFIGLYNALKYRRYDLALMRALGASRGRLVSHVLIEATLLALLGALLGLALGHVAAEIIGQAFRQTQQLNITGAVFLIQELWLVALAVGVGIMAALIPAIQAYRTDIAETLGRGR
ncbi:ABC transporter permease [Aquisalimonas asiatica]|uniref:Putative ABC transport system permease protein n=1 Tax=Aquisalimonas asiatica TaxID=406100 RepID=A0A1H8PP32_9GAMM|nr:FtsX-like permease family protein [Aquisalimonas asiatica]SEO43789.1 putative ABC transport system permease protein [Aquisalimonas asiatica]